MPDKKNVRKYFNPDEEAELIKAIQLAEQKTSGEIRIHIEEKCTGDAFARGVEVFGGLGMHKTEQRNGVLFYIATETHKFSIVADEGINAKVPEGFWDAIKDDMIIHFKNGQLVEGLKAGVLKSGAALRSHFPRLDYDENELSNEISAQ
jgi:uncharacterized membrane protein